MFREIMLHEIMFQRCVSIV